MKRFATLSFLALVIAGAGFFGSASRAQAGIFGSHKKAPATPTPSPAPIPTASPEPPSIAIPRLTAKLKKNPNDKQAALDLAREYLMVSRPDLSLPITQALLKNGVKSAQVYYFDGIGEQAVGNVGAAYADFQHASDLSPTNIAVLSELTGIAQQIGKKNAALRFAKRAVVFNPKDPDAYMLLGSAEAARKHYDAARAQYTLAAKIEPKDARPIFEIASTYAQQDNIPKALATIDVAIALDPRNVQSLVYKADLYARQHDEAHVATAYDDAVVAAKTDTQKVAILVRKGGYYAGEKKWAHAQAIFSSIVATYPHESAGFLAYGDFLLARKQEAQAAKQWQAALALDKNNPDALQRVAQYDLSQKHTSDAIGLLKRFTQVAPSAQSFGMLGAAYTVTKDYVDARDTCSKSYRLSPSPDTLGCIAGSDYKLHRYQEATKIFDVLNQLAAPFLRSNADLLFVAAKSYRHEHQDAKALAFYRALLPMMKKGTPQYREVIAGIAQLSKNPKASH